MEELGILGMSRADEATRLAPDGRQLHEHPKRNDKPEAQSHEAVGQRGAEGHNAAARPRGHASRPGGCRLLRLGDEVLHGVILEELGIAGIQVVAPGRNGLHIMRHAREQVVELGIQAEHRREQQEAHRCQHERHHDIGHRGADSPVHVNALQAVHDAAQAEHDDKRPDENGHRHREHAHKPHHAAEENDGGDDRPQIEKADARLQLPCRQGAIGGQTGVVGRRCLGACRRRGRLSRCGIGRDGSRGTLGSR